MLWFNGDHEEFSKLIAAAIAEVVVYEMLYNADLRDRTTSGNQIQIPDWYIKGLINYVARDGTARPTIESGTRLKTTATKTSTILNTRKPYSQAIHSGNT